MDLDTSLKSHIIIKVSAGYVRCLFLKIYYNFVSMVYTCIYSIWLRQSALQHINACFHVLCTVFSRCSFSTISPSGEGSSRGTSWVSWVFSVISVTARHHPLALNHLDPMQMPARLPGWTGLLPVFFFACVMNAKKMSSHGARKCICMYINIHLLWCHNLQYLDILTLRMFVQAL